MIVSTTLAGPGSAEVIGAALESIADHVDVCLVIDGGGGDEVFDVAAQVVGAKVHPGHIEWRGDYAWARNEALRMARELGATWALTLDTDERLQLSDDVDYGELLERTRVDVVNLVDRDAGYQKPRWIRCATELRWFGRVHEVLEGTLAHALAPGCFWELERSEDNADARYRRGVEWCREALAGGYPHRTRWVRHLGECLLGLGHADEAQEQFTELARIAEHPDERAWALYRACEGLIVEDRIDAALNDAARGLAAHPNHIQEFGYLLAYCHARQGNARASLRWAEYALSAPIDLTRCGHRSPTWRQGCEQLLAQLQGAS